MMVLTELFSNVFYIIIAILVLLFMVTVHEFGHYTAGRILKFKINEFSIGFGPAIFKRVSKKTGELFSLRIVPLGGYCAFDGEDTEKDSADAFNKQKPWKRIIVLLSGVLMNFLVSLLIAVIVFTASGMYFPSAQRILPDAGAAVSDEYKLKQGDIIISVNGNFLYLNGDLGKELGKIQTGEEFNATIVRNGVKQDIRLVKRNYYNYSDDSAASYALDENGNPVIYSGIGIWQNYSNYRLGFFESIGRAIVYCFKMAGVILGFFGQLISGQIGFNQIGGPITTIEYTMQVAKLGLRQLMEIITLIGVNLAVFNLLPIPALDGSRIVFVIIEWIRKKPIKREIEGRIHMVGLLLLFGFVILADLLQFIS